jgi:HEAT repeat protein
VVHKIENAMTTNIVQDIPVQDKALTPQRYGTALAHVCRALKSFSLYPEGHPLRSDSLQRAYHALQEILVQRELVLVTTRAGFVATDGGVAVEPAPMIQSLATELFIRRVKRLVILPDLTLFDLQKFLRILTLSPETVEEDGGIADLMAKRFIKSVWANEVDLSAILEKREELVVAEEQGSESFAPDSVQDIFSQTEEQQEADIDEILVRMAEETDDVRYLNLAEMLLDRAQRLREQNTLEPLMPALFFLHGEQTDDSRGDALQAHARQTLSQLLTEGTIELLLDRVGEEDSPEAEPAADLCADHWERVAPQVLQRYLNMESAAARTTLTALFIRVGKPVIPLLLPLLADEQWSVVLAVIPLVGEIGGEEVVGDLAEVAFHANARVRREAIRTLAKVGGVEAEGMLINLLNDRDPSMKLQAILSLGIMQSRQAIPLLVGMLEQRDPFLENLQLKKEAALALGRIGDRQVTPHLLRALTRGHLFARQGWLELKITITVALGYLRDPAALEELRTLARHSDRLGKACGEAVTVLERIMKDKS